LGVQVLVQLCQTVRLLREMRTRQNRELDTNLFMKPGIIFKAKPMDESTSFQLKPYLLE
jgi:hypothetical protein